MGLRAGCAVVYTRVMAAAQRRVSEAVEPEGGQRADALRLAAEAPCDWRTALRWLRGEPVSEMSRIRLERAAGRLVLSRSSAP